MTWEFGFVGKKKRFLAGSVNFSHLFNLCLLPDILEVLTDIDEMSRRRPEILAFFAVSISVSNCHWKEEVLFTRICCTASLSTSLLLLCRWLLQHVRKKVSSVSAVEDRQYFPPLHTGSTIICCMSEEELNLCPLLRARRTQQNSSVE